jgi:hypothetical protein
MGEEGGKSELIPMDLSWLYAACCANTVEEPKKAKPLYSLQRLFLLLRPEN